MTRARKFSGKTVDEATEIALAELDAELEDVEIKVISTGRSGILGFGGEPAEIEISLLGDGDSSFDDDFDEPEAMADEADEQDEPTADSGTGSSDGGSRSGRGRTRNRGRGRSRGGNGRDRDDRQPVDASSEDSGRRSEPQDDENSRNRSDDRGGRRDGRRSQRSDRQDRAERQDQPQSQDRPERQDQPISREKDEEAEQLVSELIDYFLGAMGVVAETYIREDDEDGSMTFEIEGQDAGLLIGRRGETLQSLQFLIRMVTNRQLGRKAYVVIDIEDYRERRVQMLRRLARRMAGRVGSSGREDSLEPMSPAERRIVHMALAGHPEVRTESEGEGNQRRVVIFPK
jgi:spoIIIJ-associated protein